MKNLLFTLIIIGLNPITIAQDWMVEDPRENGTQPLQSAIDGTPIIININAVTANPFGEDYAAGTLSFDEIALGDRAVGFLSTDGVVVINLKDQGVTLILNRPGSEIILDNDATTEGGQIVPDEDEPQGSRTMITILPELGVTIIRSPRPIDQ